MSVDTNFRGYCKIWSTGVNISIYAGNVRFGEIRKNHWKRSNIKLVRALTCIEFGSIRLQTRRRPGRGAPSFNLRVNVRFATSQFRR